MIANELLLSSCSPKSRTCICGKTFVLCRRDKLYCSDKCRFEAANEKKAGARRVAAAGKTCAASGCTYQSPRGRFYENTIEGRKVVLCGFHHAERYRPKPSGNVGRLLGRWYHGFLHVSIDGLEDHLIDDDGGIGQLIDHLSREVDSAGRRVPHPSVLQEFERTVYSRAPKRVTDMLMIEGQAV